MGTEQKNLDVPFKVAGKTVYGIDVKLPGMKWAAVKTCPVYGGTVKSYDFEQIRNEPGVISAVEFPIPDPSLIRGRTFSGGVAVIADHWYQAKTALDKMPIEWDVPAKNAAFDTANMRAALTAAMDQPGKVRVNIGDCDRAFSGAARIVDATYFTPYLPRARMEPGNATVLVTDNRVDIWIGDQSPQETRYSASRITGIPEATSMSTCATSAAATAATATVRRPSRRSTSPTRIAARRSTSCGRARRTSSTRPIGRWASRACARLSMPTAGRSPRGKDGDGREGPRHRPPAFDKASRYFVPNYRFSTHTMEFHVPVGTRRGVAQPANEFYRESFMDELAHAAGKDPYLYRRELISRTRASLQGRHDQGAGHRRRDVRLGQAAAVRHGAGDRAGGARRRVRTVKPRSAPRSTPSRSARRAKVRLLRVDIAHEEGFGLVNPLSVRKQIEGQITWFYNDAMRQECNVTEGRIVENNFDRFPLSRINENPPEINITFFKTGHWLDGMGHDRATSLQSTIADAVFQITGKRYRDLPLQNHDLTWS